jgi:hypothetical protein
VDSEGKAGNVFESLDTHEYVLRIIELRVLANAAVAVGCEPVS